MKINAKIPLLFCGLILCNFELFGCSSDSKNISYDVDTSLWEYDSTTCETSSTPLDNFNLSFGKEYKLVLDAKFSNLEETLGNETINVKVTVTLGDYDTIENKNNLNNSSFTEQGLNFTGEGVTGAWSSSFALSKDSQPDFGSTYFIISNEKLVDDDGSNCKPVKMEFDCIDDEDDYDMLFTGSGNEICQIDLLSIKGDFDFSYENNIKTNIGSDAKKYNMSILIPEYCGSVNVSFAKDEKNDAIYGEKLYDDESYTEEFSAGQINFIVSDSLIEFIGQDKYDEEIVKGDFCTYLIITAFGGNNYNNSVIEFLYHF